MDAARPGQPRTVFAAIRLMWAAALAVLDAVSAGGITYAPADTAAGMVHGLVALAVVFLVFNPASSRHYRTSMRNRSSLA